MVILSRTVAFYYCGAQVVAMLYWGLRAVCACVTAMMGWTLSVDVAREARKRFQPFFDVQLPVDRLHAWSDRPFVFIPEIGRSAYFSPRMQFEGWLGLNSKPTQWKTFTDEWQMTDSGRYVQLLRLFCGCAVLAKSDYSWSVWCVGICGWCVYVVVIGIYMCVCYLGSPCSLQNCVSKSCGGLHYPQVSCFPSTHLYTDLSWTPSLQTSLRTKPSWAFVRGSQIWKWEGKHCKQNHLKRGMIRWQGGSTVLVVTNLSGMKLQGLHLISSVAPMEVDPWIQCSVCSLWSNNITLWHCLHACHPVGVISLHIPRTWFRSNLMQPTDPQN